MADILVRGLDAQTVQRLKARAKRNGRWLQGEAKQVLAQAAGFTFAEVRELSRTWRCKLAGRKFPSSVPLIREDRQR